MVIDSEYAILSILKRNFPVISINNSDFIVSEYLGRKHKPFAIWWHFWIIEFCDYIFNCLFPDAVISPSLYKAKITRPKFKHVGLIIRNGLINTLKEKNHQETHRLMPRDAHSISCILSGSIFGKKIKLDFTGLPYKINIIGREGNNHDNLIYHKALMDNTTELSQADILIINAGASSTSEAIFLNKPTLVMPISGHAEQYINACILKDYGIGLICEPKDISSILRMFYEKNEWADLRINQRAIAFDGAKEAAKIILSFKRTN